jgi:hypothetical protein
MNSNHSVAAAVSEQGAGGTPALRFAPRESPGGSSKVAKARLLSCRGEPLLIADWDRALMMHFEMDAERLQCAVPFELDLWEGKHAFVSLVAFTMLGMRPRFCGRLGAWLTKPLATHEFLNVRTYVRQGGERGIHFLAEWLPNRLAVLLGPRTFGLPYRLGRLDYDHWHESEILGRNAAGGLGGTAKVAVLGGNLPPSRAHEEPSPIHERSARSAVGLVVRQNGPVARSARTPRKWLRLQGVVTDARSGNQLRYTARIDEAASFAPCPAGSLDEWLMERYTAFNAACGRGRFFRVWHEPWPQASAEVCFQDLSLLTETWPFFRDVRSVGANYSPGVSGVWMGRPHAIG